MVATDRIPGVFSAAFSTRWTIANSSAADRLPWPLTNTKASSGSKSRNSSARCSVFENQINIPVTSAITPIVSEMGRAISSLVRRAYPPNHPEALVTSPSCPESALRLSSVSFPIARPPKIDPITGKKMSAMISEEARTNISVSGR